MSMLADRKQKQRWFLNPRANKEWAQDANKFGQRMLEKMGWSTGKGLGANEDGITEQIRVKYKNDIQGIGYQLRDDQWTEHESNFTQLLANLGTGTEAEKIDHPKAEKSLEKKSQASRVRVHYHKFTRGKDLAARSEKDLANIFGRKTLEKIVKIEEKVESDNEDKDNKTFGVVTIKSGNMTDYFKSKLSKLGDKFSSAISNKEDEEESEEEISTTAGFGFSTGNKENNKQNFVNFISSNSKINEKDDKEESENEANKNFGSSANNNKKHSFISFVSSATNNENSTENSGVKRKREEIENAPKDKKKKKRKIKNAAFDNEGNNINITEEVCYDNPCLNEDDNKEEENIEEIGLDNPAFNDESDMKKIKCVTFASPLAEYATISEETSKKKKKKKKKQKIGLDNPACEEQSLEDPSKEDKTSLKRKSISLDSEEITPVKKSKKKKKNFEDGIVNLACEEIIVQVSSNIPNKENKKSKKKKKPIEVDVDDSFSEEASTPKKKKSKSKEIGITNLGCVESPVNCIDNLACNVNLVEEGIESITNAIDNFETELENEMNLRKENKKLKKERKLKNKRSGKTNETL